MSVAEIENKSETEHELKTTIPTVQWYLNISAWKKIEKKYVSLKKNQQQTWKKMRS